MKPKKIGIIGPGKHFEEKIFPIISKMNFFKIDGVLRKRNKRFKKIPIYSEKIFFRKNFDFVYICCPNKFHEKFIIKSLKSGYHVICEKPFVTRNKNINYIIELAKKKKKLLFECFMHVYHPVFGYLKSVIKNKKFGKIKYVISNFRYPSLKQSNNRYYPNKGAGFFHDAASYLISLETYLFSNSSKISFKIKKIKKKVDLRGYIFLKVKNETRHYFWGEGQNYSNNIEIFFDKATIYIDKFFSKYNKEIIYLKIFKNKNSIIKFEPKNQFKLMIKKIIQNYNSKKFRKLHYSLIKKQINFLKKFEN